MKKRIYFMISSVIQMICSTYAIFKAKEIIAPLIDGNAMYPEVMQERLNKLYQNSGATLIIVMAIVCIVLNIFVLYFAYKNKISEKRKSIMVLSIFSLLTANISVTELMAIINIIILVSEKNNNQNIVKEKKMIPNLKKENVNLVKIIKAFLLLLIYFSQMIWKNFLVNNIWGVIIPIIFYIVMIILCILLFYDLFKDNLIIFKNNFKTYMNYIFTRIGIFYLIFAVVSFICMAITKSFAANQDAIEALPLWLSIPLAVIYAPIVEETLFRGCIRRFINNDIAFMIVSGIIFGLLHTISAETVLLNVIVLAIPYGVMGGFLAYIYTKTNNIWANISCHFIFNSFAMIMSILITGI